MIRYLSLLFILAAPAGCSIEPVRIDQLPVGLRIGAVTLEAEANKAERFSTCLLLKLAAGSAGTVADEIEAYQMSPGQPALPGVSLDGLESCQALRDMEHAPDTSCEVKSWVAGLSVWTGDLLNNLNSQITSPGAPIAVKRVAITACVPDPFVAEPLDKPVIIGDKSDEPNVNVTEVGGLDEQQPGTGED